MNFLALDLGTLTGYAGIVNGKFFAGTWELLDAKAIREQSRIRFDRRRDHRIPQLYLELEDLQSVAPIDWVFFEDVTFSSTTLQTQLWAALRAAVWLWSYDYEVKIDCCPVSTLKKFATGYGAADKKTMLRYAKTRYPKWLSAGHDHLDDNAIDAIHLLAWGIQTTSRVTSK